MAIPRNGILACEKQKEAIFQRFKILLEFSNIISQIIGVLNILCPFFEIYERLGPFFAGKKINI
jgi:hypothetical protein